jgi:Ca2+-binding EF-hand superfamily protein
MKTPTITLLALLGFALPTVSGALQDRGGGRPAPKDSRAGQQEVLAANYFKVADYDGNGWISFREGSTSLGLDRLRFSLYDTDRDGRITLEEFTPMFKKTVRKIGAFRPPVPDPDDPNAVSIEELLSETDAEPDEVTEEAKAMSVLELFGATEPRLDREHASPEPDRLIGPVPPFHRLDQNGDGHISRSDLDELVLGSGLDVRLNTLIATLDTDQDGVIDEEEFFASMGGR